MALWWWRELRTCVGSSHCQDHDECAWMHGLMKHHRQLLHQPLKPHLSRRMTASQNGLKSWSLVTDKHANWAYGNWRHMNKPRTVILHSPCQALGRRIWSKWLFKFHKKIVHVTQISKAKETTRVLIIPTLPDVYLIHDNCNTLGTLPRRKCQLLISCWSTSSENPIMCWYSGWSAREHWKEVKGTQTYATSRMQSSIGDADTSTISLWEGATASGVDHCKRLPSTAAPRIHERGNQQDDQMSLYYWTLPWSVSDHNAYPYLQIYLSLWLWQQAYLLLSLVVWSYSDDGCVVLEAVGPSQV